MVCQECGNENASMNVICAYCGVGFPRSSMTTSRRRRGPPEALKWGVLAAAMVVPVVGLVPGVAYARDADRAHRAAARMWLTAGLCSTLIYMLLFLFLI